MDDYVIAYTGLELWTCRTNSRAFAVFTSLTSPWLPPEPQYLLESYWNWNTCFVYSQSRFQHYTFGELRAIYSRGTRSRGCEFTGRVSAPCVRL